MMGEEDEILLDCDLRIVKNLIVDETEITTMQINCTCENLKVID